MAHKHRLLLSAALLAGMIAPAYAQPIQYQDSDLINNIPVSEANPLPVTGSISATNPSVDETGNTAPTSATLVGSIDGSGDLQGASSTNPIPTADAALLAVVEGPVPEGDNDIGHFTPTITNLISGTITSAMTGTTSTELIAAPGSGLTNYITNFVCSNADADTDTVIALQDGNGGTTFYSAPAAHNMGGFTISFPVPLKQPTANTALYVVNETTGATTKCSASGFTR